MTGADFGYTSLASSQLYSTASYHANDLHGIGLEGNDLTAWNFAAQNLAGANFFGATLTSANLSNANLTNVNLINATLTNATFTGADLRGASGFVAGSAITTNAILPDGTIKGLQLDSTNPTLTVRNYIAPAGDSPIPIHILQGMNMHSNATLQFQLDGNAWGSTISFDAGIPVTLGGNLALGFAPGVNPMSLVDNPVQLFDWTNVSPSGQFNPIVSNLPTRYSWNTSALYTLGQVDLLSRRQASMGSGRPTAVPRGMPAAIGPAEMCPEPRRTRPSSARL